mmetsp:Transcript_10539/g.23956  ORF Transcript_10539/g.23956 Transcript_10539/m.23956 type:complete len:207 (-) Transcript_10539:94-714(-)
MCSSSSKWDTWLLELSMSNVSSSNNCLRSMLSRGPIKLDCGAMAVLACLPICVLASLPMYGPLSSCIALPRWESITVTCRDILAFVAGFFCLALRFASAKPGSNNSSTCPPIVASAVRKFCRQRSLSRIHARKAGRSSLSSSCLWVLCLRDLRLPAALGALEGLQLRLARDLERKLASDGPDAILRESSSELLPYPHSSLRDISCG